MSSTLVLPAPTTPHGGAELRSFADAGVWYLPSDRNSTSWPSCYLAFAFVSVGEETYRLDASTQWHGTSPTFAFPTLHQPSQHLEQAIFFHASSPNAGHEFFAVLNILYSLRADPSSPGQELCAIVSTQLAEEHGHAMELIRAHFPSERLVIAPPLTPVLARKLVCPQLIEIKLFPALGQLPSLLGGVAAGPMRDRVALLKTPHTVNSSLCARHFGTSVVDLLEERGFLVVRPEALALRAVFAAVHGARKLVMSWGCCSYLNSIYAHPDTDVLVLGHEGYQHELNRLREDGVRPEESPWLPERCRSARVLTGLGTELTEETRAVVSEAVRELCEAAIAS